MQIEQVIQDYGAYIYKYAYKLTCHPIDAEDLAQETFVNAWKNLCSLNSELAVKSWLTKICYRLFLMKMRQKNTQREELVDDFSQLEMEGYKLKNPIPQPEEEIEVEEEVRDLQNGCFHAMVRRLTLNQRIVFSLIDMYGMTIGDVADLLNTSESATKGLLFRARMNLDSFFADHCSIINHKNPCSCKAWIQFSQSRENLQKQTSRITTHLDYRNKNYEYKEEIRRKIKFLYENMPDRKPEESWYQKVILSLQITG